VGNNSSELYAQHATTSSFRRNQFCIILILSILHSRVAQGDPGRYWIALHGEETVGVVVQSPLEYPATLTPMGPRAVMALVVSPPYDKCGIFAKQHLEFHAGDLIGSEHRQECLNLEVRKLGARHGQTLPYRLGKVCRK
jgi:hypothetical protein